MNFLHWFSFCRLIEIIYWQGHIALTDLCLRRCDAPIAVHHLNENVPILRLNCLSTEAEDKFFRKIQSFGINKPSGSAEEFGFIIMLHDCDISQLRVPAEQLRKNSPRLPTRGGLLHEPTCLTT